MIIAYSFSRDAYAAWRIGPHNIFIRVSGYHPSKALAVKEAKSK